MNVNIEKAIEDLMDGPAYEGLMEDAFGMFFFFNVFF